LEPKKWDSSIWDRTPPDVDLANLPGTVSLFPADGGEAVAWANGELPDEVKRAGGAHWTWHVKEPGRLLCLAPQGARLFVDDKLAVECPVGLPYVPATHRSPDGSFIDVHPAAGEHTVRVELNSQDPSQQASVLLAIPNLHLCAWTNLPLPHPAMLTNSPN
jgi:hypothetical protein